MTKRPWCTAEGVVQNLHHDDLDDPEEPLMGGSDDELSDLEFDSDCDDDMDVDNLGGQHFFSPPSDNPDPGPALDPNSTNGDSDSTTQMVSSCGMIVNIKMCMKLFSRIKKPTHWDPHSHSHGSLLTPHVHTHAHTNTHYFNV